MQSGFVQLFTPFSVSAVFLAILGLRPQVVGGLLHAHNCDMTYRCDSESL